MFARRKVLLALLANVGRPLNKTELVKLAFLFRHETDFGRKDGFYDFVPYKYGPFSFALYRELDALQTDGYLLGGTATVQIDPRAAGLCEDLENTLPPAASAAISKIVQKYGSMRRRELIGLVYGRYARYVARSEIGGRVPRAGATSPLREVAVYTVGYEGKSVDAFFDGLTTAGIQAVLDVPRVTRFEEVRFLQEVPPRHCWELRH